MTDVFFTALYIFICKKRKRKKETKETNKLNKRKNKKETEAKDIGVTIRVTAFFKNIHLLSCG